MWIRAWRSVSVRLSRSVRRSARGLPARRGRRICTEVVTEQVAAGDVEDVGETDDGFDGGGGRRGEVRVQPDRGGKQPRY